MPSHCWVPLCKGNYLTGPKVSVYSFPKDEKLKNKWIAAIQRKNICPTASSRVCELHFQNADFDMETSAFDSNTGELIAAHLTVKRLKKDAVPSIFPGYPSSLQSESGANRRDSPETKKCERENAQISKAIALSISESEDYIFKTSVKCVSDIIKLLKQDDLGDFWQIHHNSKTSDLCIFNLNTDNCPLITASLLINSDLSISAFHKSQKLNKLKSFTFPYNLKNINELTDIMACLKIFPEETNKNNCLDVILQLLFKLKSQENESIIIFIEEQLKLLLMPKNNIKYSNEFLIFSILLSTISPHAYRFLRSVSKFILPHPSTLRKICQCLTISPENEFNPANFLSYAKMQFKYLKPHEPIVNLLIDEIHVKPYFDYKGGTVLGAAVNSDEAAKSVFVFMVTGVMSSLKEVVHVMPVNKITYDLLYEIIVKIITGLEGIGYKVICVITDNNSINGKAMSLFSSPPQISYCYSHPIDKSRPLFYLIDSVHLFKCIRNNWLNQKDDEVSFVYPDFDGKDVLHNACFKTLKKLYDIDCNSFVKFAHGLNLKSLSPSNLERQNVQLVIKVFNKFVIEALKSLGPDNNLRNYEETANFIDIILKWWEIMNVKSPNKGTNKLNLYMTPLKSQADDKKNMFLSKFLSWLDRWQDKKLTTGTLTKQTHKALVQTTFGIIQLAEYCKDEFKMSYILPGKFQTDCLESRFGKYRQLAGAQYNISVRQLVECEKKLRLQSLVRFDFPISSSKFVLTPVNDMPDTVFNEFSVSEYDFLVDVTETDIQNAQKYIVVLTYLAGYCCHSICKNITCSECKELLVSNHELHFNEQNYLLIKNLDRGGLLWPKEISINCVVYNFVVVSKIMKERCTLQRLSQREIIVNATLSILDLYDLLFENELCSAGHRCNDFLKKVVWISTNIFLKNFCATKNDEKKKLNNNENNNDLSKKRKLSTLKQCKNNKIKKSSSLQ